MVFDRISNLRDYERLIPDIPVIEEYLNKLMTGEIAGERFEIDGERLFLTVQEYESYPKEGRQLEAHRKYIDLQAVIFGREKIGWAETEGLTLEREKFSSGGDIAFYKDEPEFWLPMREGSFTLLFPQDAHMPCIRFAAEGEKVRKVVVKIAI